MDIQQTTVSDGLNATMATTVPASVKIVLNSWMKESPNPDFISSTSLVKRLIRSPRVCSS